MRPLPRRKEHATAAMPRLLPTRGTHFMLSNSPRCLSETATRLRRAPLWGGASPIVLASPPSTSCWVHGAVGVRNVPLPLLLCLLKAALFVRVLARGGGGSAAKCMSAACQAREAICTDVQWLRLTQEAAARWSRSRRSTNLRGRLPLRLAGARVRHSPLEAPSVCHGGVCQALSGVGSGAKGTARWAAPLWLPPLPPRHCLSLANAQAPPQVPSQPCCHDQAPGGALALRCPGAPRSPPPAAPPACAALAPARHACPLVACAPRAGLQAEGGEDVPAAGDQLDELELLAQLGELEVRAVRLADGRGLQGGDWGGVGA